MASPVQSSGPRLTSSQCMCVQAQAPAKPTAQPVRPSAPAPSNGLENIFDAPSPVNEAEAFQQQAERQARVQQTMAAVSDTAVAGEPEERRVRPACCTALFHP